MVWHILRIKDKGLAVSTGSIPPDCLACYHIYHDGMTEKREVKKRGAEELMTALTKQKKEATQKLQVRW